MSYNPEFPVKPSGYGVLMQKTEELMHKYNILPPQEYSGEGVMLRYRGVSMPAAVSVNASGVGPKTVRPWLGGINDPEAITVLADLEIGIRSDIETRHTQGRWLSLGIRNFKEQQGRIEAAPITVGRPISEHARFGADMEYEAYTGMRTYVLIRRGWVVRAGMEVTTEGGDSFDLLQSTTANAVERQPAYLLGSTCLLAASRTSKPAEIIG